jgi:hypothetical protein
MNVEEKEQKDHVDVQKETLKPITKTKSKEDEELGAVSRIRNQEQILILKL